MKKIIFIGGIHGVGKTYFCSEVSKKYKMTHYSASDLISRKRNKEFTKNKKVEKINDNQNTLIEAINESMDSEGWFILDGHFCLLNKEGDVVTIHEETFEALSPRGVVVLTDAVENIKFRLNNRDNIKYDTKLLEEFQNKEIEHSKKISTKFNIPYFVYNNTNVDKFNEFMCSIMNIKEAI